MIISPCTLLENEILSQVVPFLRAGHKYIVMKYIATSNINCGGRILLWSLPRAHAQGVKQSVCPSVVVVVVGTKIAISRVLGVCACCKHNQSVDIDEKLVCTGFKLLKKAY